MHLLLTLALLAAPADPCRNPRYGCVGGKSPQAWERAVRVATSPPADGDHGCLKRLRRAHIKFRVLENVRGVKTPIEVLDTSLGLIRYRRTPGNRRRFILDCRTVEVLAALGRSLRRVGIATLYWSSAWRYTTLRASRELSQHAFGRALDITAADGPFGYASVKGHWERGADRCGHQAKTKRGRKLRQLACALTAGGAFARIFTPDTDADHLDHFHLDGPDGNLRHEPWKRKRRRPRGVLIAVAGAVALGLVVLVVGFLWRRRRRRAADPPGS